MKYEGTIVNLAYKTRAGLRHQQNTVALLAEVAIRVTHSLYLRLITEAQRLLPCGFSPAAFLIGVILRHSTERIKQIMSLLLLSNCEVSA